MHTSWGAMGLLQQKTLHPRDFPGGERDEQGQPTWGIVGCSKALGLIPCIVGSYHPPAPL